MTWRRVVQGAGLAGLAMVGGLAAIGCEVAFAQDKPAPPPAVAVVLDTAIRDLGNDDYAVRQRAEDRLVGLGANAVPALEKAASSSDLEVARRAQRALARIRDAAARKAAPAEKADEPDPMERAWRRVRPEPRTPDAPADPDDPFADLDAWMRRAFEGFGADPFGGGGRPGEDPFDGLRRMMRAIEERHRKMFADPFGGLDEDPLGAPDAPDAGRGPSVRFEIAPGAMLHVQTSFSDGNRNVRVTREGEKVKVEVSEPDAAGVPKTTTYEAETESAFREKHPDAARWLDQGGARFQVRFGGGGLRFNGPGQGFGFGRPPANDARPAQRQAREGRPESLGLATAPLSPVVRFQLALPEGQGLFLDAVEPEGWAAKAGLQRYDVVLTAAGRPVGSVAALEAARAAAEETLALEVFRRGERVALRAPR